MQSDLDTHEIILSKKSLLIGITDCKTYEMINMVQCVKCVQYGHFATECNLCANCVEANKTGRTLNTRHRPTDGRCVIRRERIDGIKCTVRKWIFRGLSRFKKIGLNSYNYCFISFPKLFSNCRCLKFVSYYSIDHRPFILDIANSKIACHDMC